MDCGITSSCASKVEGHHQLILDHLGLAKTIALRISQTLPVHVELDDLIHAGVLGLLDAANKYDTSKKVQFSGYAKYRIRGAILDSLRKLDTASRGLRRRRKKIETVRLELRGTLQRDPTETEIVERLDISIKEFRKIMLEAQNTSQVLTCFTSLRDDGLPEHDFESGPETRPDRMFSVIQMRAVLDGAMRQLRPRQQQVVRAYYSEHKTMKEIGLTLGINESRVSQLHKAALEKMRSELVAKGVQSGGAF